MKIFKLIKYDMQLTHYINCWKDALKNRGKFEESTDDYKLWETRCIYYSSEYEAIERKRTELVNKMKAPYKK